MTAFDFSPAQAAASMAEGQQASVPIRSLLMQIDTDAVCLVRTQFQQMRSMPLRCFRVRTLAVTHVRFVHVLEQRIALCLVRFLCVSARQAIVESVLDRKPHAR